MTVSRETIEREARQAAAQGLSIDEACPYPFGSDQATHFKAIYLLALTRNYPQNELEDSE